MTSTLRRYRPFRQMVGGMSSEPAARSSVPTILEQYQPGDSKQPRVSMQQVTSLYQGIEAVQQARWGSTVDEPLSLSEPPPCSCLISTPLPNRSQTASESRFPGHPRSASSNEKRTLTGSRLVFKAHRLMYHPALGL